MTLSLTAQIDPDTHTLNETVTHKLTLTQTHLMTLSRTN